MDVFLAVIGRCRAAVPQRPGVSQAEALVELHQRVDGRRRQEVAVARVLWVRHFLLLLLRGRSLQAGLGRDVGKVLTEHKDARSGLPLICADRISKLDLSVTLREIR